MARHLSNLLAMDKELILLAVAGQLQLLMDNSWHGHGINFCILCNLPDASLSLVVDCAPHWVYRCWRPCWAWTTTQCLSATWPVRWKRFTVSQTNFCIFFIAFNFVTIVPVESPAQCSASMTSQLTIWVLVVSMTLYRNTCLLKSVDPCRSKTHTSWQRAVSTSQQVTGWPV